MSLQYHPEAAPGPLDSAHLFTSFRELGLRRRLELRDSAQ
jgi:carbamoylphosphate synthase small subunit